jgi:hypothetical protein
MRTTRQQVLIETHAARQRAIELLKSLQQAQTECEAHLKADQRADVVKAVTGQSSIEAAIASTRRMIETLDRAVEDARNSLVEPDHDVLDEIEPEELAVQVKAKIGQAEVGSLRRWA